MKKVLILLFCLILLLSASGCGENSKKDNASENSNVTEQFDEKEKKNESKKDDPVPKEDSQKADKNEENFVDVPSGTNEAPIIESTDELESIVDEFNTTEDPEKKEELRKKLEAFLAQAEESAE